MTKAQQRDALARDVARYLKAGGTIDALPAMEYSPHKKAGFSDFQFGNKPSDGETPASYFQGADDDL